MKRLLLFSVLSIFCLTISAQTKTWVGPSGGSYSVSSNWSPAGVPNQNNDVIVPTGSDMIIDIEANIKSIAVQGNSHVTMRNTLYFTNTSSIAANASFTWQFGYLQGTGTLNNNGSFTIIENINKYIEDTTIINNAGTINFPVGFYLFLGDGSIINNLAAGVIDFQSDANIVYDGTAGHILNNAGLIKKSGGIGVSTIEVALNNTGIISLETGEMNLYGEEKTFNGGVYNVNAGSVMRLGGDNINFEGTLTGQLDGEMNWTNYVTVANTAILDFDGNGFNWTSGYLKGDGVLTNNGTLTFPSTVNKYIENATTLENLGIINFEIGCYLFVNDDSVLDNTASGVIDFKSDGNITYGGNGSHILINSGLIKKTVGTTSFLDAKLVNTGTISVEAGQLNLYGEDKTFNGGVYNVNAGSVMSLGGNNINLEGTLTGQLDGEMNWTNYVTVANAATLDFDGNGFSWTAGYLQGDGVLTNKSVFNFPTPVNKYMYGTTILENQGIINFTVPSTLFVGDDSNINNTASGVIDFKADASVATSENGSINNAGVLKKTTGTGIAYFYLPVTNSGTIDIQSGTMTFVDGNNFTNTVNGKVMGIGTIDVPVSANFTNDGIFSPGGYPGTLTVIGDYKSTSNSDLQIEIYGYNQGTEYDLLAIQGNAIMDGDIPVYLAFEANIGDEFVILTANNITSCNLPATVTAHHDGNNYTFDVICNPTNVTLKITNIVLGTEENTLSNISMYPNPSNGRFTINLGREYTDVTVQVINMLGQVISSSKYASARSVEKEINAPAGIYFVKVSTAKEGSKTLRIIKQ
ncbi:T9SS type A sorting domain-containing protein [Aequorivita todarodis]|uniref:T9SS type A sorting domain-containing protein n=1 Tax=Aequorivita todarodis TaxID=2036821 RepID=UPI002350BD08|nr:T9SS type A sorting domain-containing protein [Aequorivita todarodis]MDC8001706.1 T9SS type A sorting domain-containing protein [Aequorivita todarodis]